MDAAAKACQSLIGTTWQNARYNEDLGTNPVWSPPHHGANALAVPDWWTMAAGADLPPRVRRGRRRGARRGRGRRGRVVAHRAGWRAAIRRRCAEIYALHRAAAISSPTPAPVARAQRPRRGSGHRDAARRTERRRRRAARGRGGGTRAGDRRRRRGQRRHARGRRVAPPPRDGWRVWGGGRRRRDRLASDAFAAAFASLCARAAAGLRAEDDDAVARAANGAVPFAFYAVADAGVGATAGASVVVGGGPVRVEPAGGGPG